MKARSKKSSWSSKTFDPQMFLKKEKESLVPFC
jgi:hypothetical protein